jgi:gingipain R
MKFMQLGKKALLITSILSMVNSVSYAEWQALNRESGKNVNFSVAVQRTNEQLVNVTVPGYDLTTQEIDGEVYSVIRVPGYPGLTEEGNPDVPRIAANFIIPSHQAPAVQVVSDDYVDIQLTHPLISSKGNFTRDISPENVPYTFSDVYEKDEFYPRDFVASVSEPFVVNKVDGVNIHLNFFQYNPVTKVLRIHNNVQLSMDNPVQKSIDTKVVPTFVNQMLGSFKNFDAVAQSYRIEPSVEADRMLVICYDDFVEAAKPFVEWKKKTGIPVKMVTLSEVGTTAEDIRDYVRNEFEAGGLGYLHLIGDVEQIPTLRGTVERAHSDQSYGLLAGDDWYLDIIVSRFSAKTAEKVAYQVAKTIQYEAHPFTGEKAAFYTKGVGIASNEGNPKDWEYANELRDALLGFTYDSVDQIYDPSANPAKVAEAVNAGRSVMNYIGHGSSTSWVSSGFNTGHIAKLSNGYQMPYIWSVACVNGDFAGYRESFAEAWLNAGGENDVKGAVAIAAASTNMQWIPPLHWQAEINKELVPKGDYKSFGGLSLNGMAKIAEVYGPTSKSFKMFVEQTNNFGDGSLGIRYTQPVELLVSNIRFTDSMVHATVTDKSGKKMAGMKVTAYNKDLDTVKTGLTDASGNVALDFSGTDVKELAITVTGTNVVPVVDKKVRQVLHFNNFEELYQ